MVAYRGKELTWEEYAELIKPYINTYGDQDENGIDLSLIRENLKLTATERVRQGDRHARGTERLIELGRRYRQEQVRKDR